MSQKDENNLKITELNGGEESLILCKKQIHDCYVLCLIIPKEILCAKIIQNKIN